MPVLLALAAVAAAAAFALGRGAPSSPSSSSSSSAVPLAEAGRPLPVPPSKIRRLRMTDGTVVKTPYGIRCGPPDLHTYSTHWCKPDLLPSPRLFPIIQGRCCIPCGAGDPIGKAFSSLGRAIGGFFGPAGFAAGGAAGDVIAAAAEGKGCSSG